MRTTACVALVALAVAVGLYMPARIIPEASPMPAIDQDAVRRSVEAAQGRAVMLAEVCPEHPLLPACRAFTLAEIRRTVHVNTCDDCSREHMAN